MDNKIGELVSQARIANLTEQRDALLEACKAEQAFWDHWTDCPLCQAGMPFCADAIELQMFATIARKYAITKAKGESDETN